ncbi:MAG: hypothetical protein ACJAZF_002093 [Granulosicoccus sp.]
MCSGPFFAELTLKTGISVMDKSQQSETRQWGINNDYMLKWCEFTNLMA